MEKTKAKLERLIAFLNSRKPLSDDEAKVIEDRFKVDWLIDSEDEVAAKIDSLKRIRNPLSFLSRDDSKQFLRERNNDLDFHITVVNDSFEHYFLTNEHPAPGYPFRIAVILRKAGETDLEMRFLNAWLNYFPAKGKDWGTYTKLHDRRDKLLEKITP